MNKFYDKLLLLLAVLALIGGIAYYFLNAGKASPAGNGSADLSTTDPYEAIPIPDSDVRTAEWPAPGHQTAGEDWVYDVFTPPFIFIDEDGNFTAEKPVPPPPPQPFGVYLDKFFQKPYRIQIQGFSGDRKKPQECVIFLFDEERQMRFFIRPGQTNEEAGVEVLDFVIDRKVDAAAGEVTVTVYANILDKRTGKTVKLVDGERLFEDGVTIVLKSKEDPGFELLNPKVGVSFENELGSYTLKEINLEERSVTVEKQATEDFEAETRRLFLESFTEPTEPEPEPETEPIELPVDFGDAFFGPN